MAGMRLSVKSNVTASPLGRIAASFAAFALFAGIAGAVLPACGTELPISAVSTGCIAAACAIVAGCVLVLASPKAERLFYIIAAAAIAAACLILRESFASGGACLANDLIMRIGERTQEYALPFSVGTEADLALFCGVCAFALGLVCSLMAQHGGALPVIVVGAAALAGTAVGWVAIGWWAPALALGACLLVGCRSVFASDATARSSLIWSFIGILAVCAIAVGATAVATRSETAPTQSVQSAIGNMLWKMRYGDAEFAMPEGNLRNVGALKASDQVAMTVTTDRPTFEYLRGFVGERYADNAWQPLESGTVMDARDMLYWLSEDGFEGAGQLTQAARLTGFEDEKPVSLSIATADVRGPYAYLPYGYASGSPSHLTTDMAQTRLDGGTAQSIVFGSDITRRAYLLQEAVDKVQGQTGMQPELRTYLDDENAYRAFAKNAYLDIPDDVRKAFQKLYGTPAKLTTEQAKIQVLYHLDDTVAYADGTKDADDSNAAGIAVPADEDFVEYFLTESREGYSVHYATAATLLLRYYGVPARYVEGYVLNTMQLDKEAEEAAKKEGGSADADGDGASAAADSAAGTSADVDAGDGKSASANTYTLTEKQAHAWVEYYLDGVGWLPYDVTPGWRAGGYYETTPNTELINESQNWSVGQAMSDAVWNPPEPEPEPLPDEEDDNPLPLLSRLVFLLVEWPWVLAGFLLTLLVAFVIRDALLHARLSRFLAQATDKDADPDEAVPALFAYAVLLMRECGGDPLVNEPFAGQGKAVSAARLCSEDAFARAAEANDRALFSTGHATAADVRSVAGCINQLHEGLRQTVGVPRRFWQRHVRCLW